MIKDPILISIGNTTIGIVICKKNDKNISKYNNPNIYVSSYELIDNSLFNT